MQKQSVPICATISMASRRLLAAGPFDKARHRRQAMPDVLADGDSDRALRSANPVRDDAKIIVTGDASGPDQLRRDAGRARDIAEYMSEHVRCNLLQVARARGYTRVSLETGRGEAFDPAIALYRKHGFVDCPAFAGYVRDGFSQCMTLVLSP